MFAAEKYFTYSDKTSNKSVSTVYVPKDKTKQV
jgi:hypothetical protein